MQFQLRMSLLRFWKKIRVVSQNKMTDTSNSSTDAITTTSIESGDRKSLLNFFKVTFLHLKWFSIYVCFNLWRVHWIGQSSPAIPIGWNRGWESWSNIAADPTYCRSNFSPLKLSKIRVNVCWLCVPFPFAVLGWKFRRKKMLIAFQSFRSIDRAFRVNQLV